MKGMKALAIVLAAIGLLVTAMPATAGAKSYKKYVACGTSKHAKPKHVCPKGSKKGAFFKSFKKDVVYTICVRFPHRGTRCAKGQEAEKGILYVNEVTSNEPGRHKATWWVKGKKVGTYFFRVKR